MNAILDARTAIITLRDVVNHSNTGDPQMRKQSLITAVCDAERSLDPISYATSFSREIRQMVKDLEHLRAVAEAEIKRIDQGL